MNNAHPSIDCSPRRVRGNDGFTLLELSIVIAIIGISSIALVSMFSSFMQKTQYQQTIAKMDAIQKAFLQFRYAYNRLPCPADATIPVTTLNFGIEAANPGACTGGAPVANFLQSPSVGPQDAREGMVPTKTLELPDDYAFDGWGRRFMYVVSKDFTQPGAFSVIAVNDGLQRMIILNAEGTPKTTQAAEVLISFGINGHGAFPRGGGATRINASSQNADEHHNCDCDQNLTPSGLDGTFVQKDLTLDATNSLDYFDDIVYFTARGDYLLPSNIMAQPFNFNAAGAGAGSIPQCLGGMPLCVISGGVKQCVCGN